MTLLTTIAATSAPVSRADLMAQLGLDDTADASQLERLDQMIADAIGHLAHETGLTLAPTDFELRLDCWPCGRRVPLPASPIREVAAVVYFDVGGAEQPVDGALWRFEPAEVGGDLWFASEFSGPELADWPGSLRIRFAAGFDDPAATGDGVDPRLAFDGLLRQAVILLAAAWFVNREEIPPGVATAIEQAISRRRVYR